MIIADGTPLIHLSRIRKLDLLKNVFSRVFIPESVYTEVVVRGREKGRVDAELIAMQPWILKKNLNMSQQEEAVALLKLAKIDRGEAEAIILSKHEKSSLLIDDAVGVKVAQTFGLETYWTTTVFFKAIREKKITREEAKQCIENLVKTGYRLKPEILVEILHRLSEK